MNVVFTFAVDLGLRININQLFYGRQILFGTF